MLDNAIIDVGLGLIFFYVTLSLVVSSIQEWIASLFKLRAQTLRKGIDRLLGSALAADVFQHPMIRNLAISDSRTPSYIDTKTLSAVVLDIVARNQDGQSLLTQSADQLKAAVEKIPAGNPIGDVLKTAVVTGDNVAQDLSAYLAGWFDEGMERISGWYKRDAKVITLVIAVVLTAVTNAGTVRVAEELWANEGLRASIAAQAEVAAKAADLTALKQIDLESLKSFPIGWASTPILEQIGDPKTLIGWLITIAAISLGAPFWFDLLGKVASLKGAGGTTHRNRTPPQEAGQS